MAASIEKGAQAAAALWRAGLDWLYPRRCLACDAEIASLGALCAACWRETALIDPPLCRRCGAPRAFTDPLSAAAAESDAPPPGGSEPAGCAICRDRPHLWRETRAAAVYAGGARRLVLALKHGDRLEAAPAMAAWMARIGAPLLAERGGARPYLIPAPLHWRRRLARRCNQAALLAAEIARLTDAPLAEDALRRPRATPSLEGLSRAERAAVLAGAVAVAPGWPARLRGAPVVLVDDVLTTGATLNACAAALQEAGAASVDALVFARAARGLNAPPPV